MAPVWDVPPGVSPNASLSVASLASLFSTLQPVACVHPDSPQQPPLVSSLGFLCPPCCSLWPMFIVTALTFAFLTPWALSCFTELCNFHSFTTVLGIPSLSEASSPFRGQSSRQGCSGTRG